MGSSAYPGLGSGCTLQVLPAGQKARRVRALRCHPRPVRQWCYYWAKWWQQAHISQTGAKRLLQLLYMAWLTT
ncbi:MAG: hypothetical protein EAY75_06095 [Bacteroidetes bacterium]|nr:MAG: hypothetical protein EAY75_06095 [Bacteroidota bacterium]